MQEGRKEKTTARLIGNSSISLMVGVAIIAMIEHPAEVFFGSFFLTIIVRLFLIEIFHRAFQRTSSEDTKARLQRVVRPPHEGAYIGEGGQSTLIGNLLLVSLFFWPFAWYGFNALLEQTALTLIVWMVFVLRDLLGGGIFMDYDKPVEVNFGYNLNYMWVLVVGILVALATFVVAAPLGLPVLLLLFPGLESVVDVQFLWALVLVVSIQVVDLMAATDKTNIGSPENMSKQHRKKKKEKKRKDWETSVTTSSN